MMPLDLPMAGNSVQTAHLRHSGRKGHCGADSEQAKNDSMGFDRFHIGFLFKRDKQNLRLWS